MTDTIHTVDNRVLFIDDDEDMLSSLARMFARDATIRVETAASGAEALKILDEQPVAVVVSDLKMPGMDGLSLLRSIKQVFPETKRIMLSGYADREVVLEALNYDLAYQFLTKPFSAPDLFRAVQQALAAHRHEQVSAHRLAKSGPNAFGEKQFYETVQAVVSAAEVHAPASTGHGFRTALLCRKLAEAVSKDKVYFPDFTFFRDDYKELEYAALLHDVGNLYINPAVLGKGTKLNGERYSNIMLRLKQLSLAAEVRHLATARMILAGESEEHVKQTGDREVTGEIGEVKRRLKEIGDVLSDYNSVWETREEARADLEDLAIDLNRLSEKLLGPDEGPIITDEEIETLTLIEGTLSREERRKIENHVLYSYTFLKKISWPKKYARVPDIVLKHHERLDGTGYPSGLVAPEIPLQSRIIAMADTFDAITAADRSYRKALTPEAALAEIEKSAEEGALDYRLFMVFKENRIYEALGADRDGVEEGGAE